MDIVTADARDVDDLTRVEIESKVASIPRCVDPIEIDHDRRRERWHTYFAGKSPASAKPERIVFKAMIAGEMVGFVAGHLSARHGTDAEVQSFYVLARHQRQGIGTVLLRRFVTWLAEHDARSLCVGIAHDNPYQAFYLEHGGTHLNPHWLIWHELATLRERISEPQLARPPRRGPRP